MMNLCQLFVQVSVLCKFLERVTLP